MLPPWGSIHLKTDNPMGLMVRKLATRVSLDDDDCAAIMALPYVRRSFNPTAYVIREGAPAPHHCDLIEEGFAFRQKLTLNGARQIVSVHLAGDFLDMQHLFLNIADHNVQALNQLRTIAIERGALQQLALDRPMVGRAMWIDALVDASIYREWVVNVGRRDARARIAHVLCEVYLRAEAAGIAGGGRFELPMTQEQLADAVGLTPVHVSRTLKLLIADGIINRDRRMISFGDWKAVSAIGDFNPLYLHLDQAKPADLG